MQGLVCAGHSDGFGGHQGGVEGRESRNAGTHLYTAVPMQANFWNSQLFWKMAKTADVPLMMGTVEGVCEDGFEIRFQELLSGIFNVVGESAEW